MLNRLQRSVLLAVPIAALGLGCAAAEAKGPEIRHVRLSADKVSQYEKLEIAVDLAANYEDPFDPDQVALDTHFRLPSGKTMDVPGFYTMDFTGDDGVRKPAAETGHWAVRFTSGELGKHEVCLALKDRQGEVRSATYAFEVTASADRGFIRSSPSDPHQFAFDNGDWFFAIGHCIHVSPPLPRVDETFRKMADGGENHTRLMQTYAGGWAIETGQPGTRSRYDLAVADRWDRIVELAGKHGIYLMFSFNNVSDLMPTHYWDKNPYNKALGGPCEKPQDFFTNEVAHRLYKNRLRYIVARWGFSTHVHSWEFFNEVDQFLSNALLSWHRQMSDYLHSIDPWKHPVTTSFWHRPGAETDPFWGLPNIHIVQTHCYTDGDMAETVSDLCRQRWERFCKPHVFAEVGLALNNPGASMHGTPKKDPTGIYLHNSAWAALMSGCASTPMSYWHDGYIDAMNLYWRFRGIANFVKGENLAAGGYQPVRADRVEYVTRPPLRTEDLVVLPGHGTPPEKEFVVHHDGRLTPPLIRLQGRLQGAAHRDEKNPPTFVVDYKTPGRFGITVGQVAAQGRLVVDLDAERVLDRELPCGEKIGKSWRKVEQYNIWVSTYDETFWIDVPAGKHRIFVDNQGRDSIDVTRYTFTDYKTNERPPLRVYAMRSPQRALLWAQNEGFQWQNRPDLKPPQPVPPTRVRLAGLQPGACAVEFWDTQKGVRTRSQDAKVNEDGTLVLELPEITADLALKIAVRERLSQTLDTNREKLARKTGFLAGTCEVSITPPVGAPLLDNMRRSTGVHDDLFARVLVLGDGEHKAAIVCLDLEGIDFSWADEIREKVRARTGIATTLVNICHTHSAPFLMHWDTLGGEWFQEGAGLQWQKELVAKVVDAVAQANAHLVSARLRVGRAPVQVGSNRRLPTEKGIVMKPNPNGAVVPWVDVLCVDDAGGSPIAVLFSHAAHPVIVHGASTLTSADYPGYAVKEVKRRLGGGVTAMFAQGCCGNINGDPLRGGFEAAERAGQMLGGAAAQAAAESKPLEPAELRIASATAALPFQDLPSPEECKRALVQAEERLAKAGKAADSFQRRTVASLRDLLAKSERGERQTLRFEIQLLAVGKAWCLLAMPHEVFAEYQLWADKESPFAHTMVLAYTGGCESYVPTDRDFPLGGYEAAHTPTPGAAALTYPYRAALRPGIEQEIRRQIQALWSGMSAIRRSP